MSAARKTPRFDWRGPARHGALALTGLFALAPFLWMLSLSLKPPEEIFQPELRFWPQNFHGWENYLAALTAAPLHRFLLNGLGVCAAIFLLQMLVCVPCAYALAKLRFRGRDTLFAAVLVGLLVPPQALAIPHFVLLHLFGLLDSYAALVLPWAISTLGIFLLRQFFRGIPDELIDAARLDGMGEFEIIWRVMLPVAVPALAAFGIFSVVAHWNDLFWPLVAIRSEELSTPALGILLFRDDEAGQMVGPLMAGATLIVAPLVLAFLFAQQRFIDGISVTART
ncbi:MAG: carbohydrate ABC transporter permease [Bosea sp.]|uniref:carbohydrate ABC transporter permease n=1 Tax=Bosea sp. (in: a-proteobacteria) TaxID=1871050 RepID=UPI0023837121|nr:carbohydrate ABC transporter permease [Bosea sp. (in: a-proteobacteria)]MCP4736996.1 carbohydrate ABC transporter permease [Bosea sp. (in: a-proteobacteria)]